VVALARAGEHVAFEELVRRRHSYIRALLSRLCRDTTLTDDLVQEAFLIAWRELPGLKTLAAFGGSPGKITAAGVQLWGPSGAGVWSSPTVDTKRRRIYVTTGNSHSDPTATTSDAFVAFDLDTGRLVWSQQMTAHDAYTLACDLPESMRVALSDAKIQAVAPGTPGAQFALGTFLKLDPKEGGGLFAFDLATGEQRWHTPHPGCCT